eukprot:CAMPEP_0172423456 /NCGR_PEP_ID=MMETSP1064-20121228/16666_1 /TAXON_ID=202472 /ORGANISM="Aulacoseira subarctica , Strain CCAP 1002/5" /LENGTH=156 /DNA_ID=CAMNT_0013164853 /DNA_START=85 /DNA_END=555 /DNA_ORIENTATION=+
MSPLSSSSNNVNDRLSPVDGKATDIDPSVIDLDGILEQMDNDDDFMRELLQDFRCEIRAQLLKMSQVLPLLQEGGDFGALQRASQSMKDASLDMLCREVNEAAATLECYAKERNLKGCVTASAALEDAARTLLDVLDCIDLEPGTWNADDNDQTND